MSAIICFQHPVKGTMSVLVPMLARLKGETNAEYKARYDAIDLEALVAKDVPAGAPFEICDSLDLPKGREFRNAWVNHPTRPGLEVDMPKARVIHMDRIRAKRDEALAASDGPMLRAMENNDAPEIARLKAERQALREIPQTFALNGATTPAELSALWPPGLAR